MLLSKVQFKPCRIYKILCEFSENYTHFDTLWWGMYAKSYERRDYLLLLCQCQWPGNTRGDMLAVAEAVVGQIYLTVLIARLVALNLVAARADANE